MVKTRNRKKLSPPRPGVQSHEKRRKSMQQAARANAKIIEEKRQLALKKHSRKVKESWVQPEKTPSISPESRAQIMRRHGNTKNPAFDHKHFSQWKGRKLDLPAAAKDKNAESGRPPYRGGEKGAGRHLTIYRSDETVGKSQPYVRRGEVRSTRKAPVSYQEPLTSSPPSYTDSATSSPAPSSSSVEFMSPIRPRPVMRSNSVDLSSSRDVTPPRKHRAPSPASSTGSRPSPSLNIPARNTAKRKCNFELVVKSRQLRSPKKLSGPKSRSALTRKLEAARAGSSPSLKRRSPLSPSKLNAPGSHRKQKSGTSMNIASAAKLRSISR